MPPVRLPGAMSSRWIPVMVLVACTPIDRPEKPAAQDGAELVAVRPHREASDGLPWQWSFDGPPTDPRPWTPDTFELEVSGGRVKVAGGDALHVAFEGRWSTKLGDGFADTAAIAVAEDAVYAAYYHRIATGARVAKLRIADGSIAWDVALVGAGPIAHSKYRNDVQVQIMGNRVHVYGWESGGAYVEVLDTESGAQLDHTAVPQTFTDLPWTWRGDPDAWERAPVVFTVDGGASARLEDGDQARLRIDGGKTIALPRGEGELGTGAGVLHDGTIFFAHASGISTGAWLYAIRPSDGAILWEKRLLGIGLVAHSEYWNMLQIAVVDDAVVVYGNEASGRYVEVVDPKSGDTIVNKAWRPK